MSTVNRRREEQRTAETQCLALHICDACKAARPHSLEQTRLVAPEESLVLDGRLDSIWSTPHVKTEANYNQAGENPDALLTTRPTLLNWMPYPPAQGASSIHGKRFYDKSQYLVQTYH